MLRNFAIFAFVLVILGVIGHFAGFEIALVPSIVATLVATAAVYLVSTMANRREAG